MKKASVGMPFLFNTILTVNRLYQDINFKNLPAARRHLEYVLIPKIILK
jgi:hypothetical protein